MKTLAGREWITDVRIGDMVEFQRSTPATGSAGIIVTDYGVVVALSNTNPECFRVEVFNGVTYNVFPFEMKLLSRMD